MSVKRNAEQNTPRPSARIYERILPQRSCPSLPGTRYRAFAAELPGFAPPSSRPACLAASRPPSRCRTKTTTWTNASTASALVSCRGNNLQCQRRAQLQLHLCLRMILAWSEKNGARSCSGCVRYTGSPRPCVWLQQTRTHVVRGVQASTAKTSKPQSKFKHQTATRPGHAPLVAVLYGLLAHERLCLRRRAHSCFASLVFTPSLPQPHLAEFPLREGGSSVRRCLKRRVARCECRIWLAGSLLLERSRGCFRSRTSGFLVCFNSRWQLLEACDTRRRLPLARGASRGMRMTPAKEAQPPRPGLLYHALPFSSSRCAAVVTRPYVIGILAVSSA